MRHTTVTSLALGLAVLTFAASALADWDDDDRFFNARCDVFNGEFKTAATCAIDHPSFEKEKLAPQDLQPSDPHPNDLCGQIALYNIYNENTALSCGWDKGCHAGVAKAVKKVICKAGKTNAVALQAGGTLVITVNSKAGDSPDLWMQAALNKLFPYSKK
jgi:hypothetical protein